MHRYRFLLFRPLQLLPVLLGISIITFAMVRAIPGDPARILLGVHSTPEALVRIRAQFGLDEPLWVQYGYFLRNLLQGEMGKSIVYRVDTLKLINSRLEPTLWLVFGSVLLAVILTIPLASLAARQRGRLAFLAGLILAPLLYTVFFHHPDVTLSTSTPGLLLAGFLVGVGTRLGSGCTSGHGVCGLSRFSIRSLVVTLVFMVVGFATATLIGYFQW